MTRLRKLADRFLIPAFPDTSSDTFYRARLTLLFGLVGLPVGVGFGVYYFVAIDQIAGGVGLVLAGLLSGATPAILRRTRSVRVGASLLVLCVFAIATYVVWLRGGFPKTALIWYIVVPILAAQLISARAAWIWTGVSVASTLAVWLLYRLGRPLPARMGLDESVLVDLDMMGVVVLLLVFVALAVMHDRARADLLVENAQLQLATQQKERLESLGRMAGGICHDFNNLLAVILSHADMILEELDESDPRREDLQSILQAGRRGAELTSQLLAFTHHRCATPTEAVDLNAVVLDLQEILKRTIGENIAVVSSLAEQVEPVRIDRGQLEQVIVNLALNARDAMEDGGTLTLETQAVGSDGAVAERVTDRSDSAPRFVRLIVQDTGCGMSDSVKAHVFEPFFTTKSRGKGTGLGLATAYGIINQAGGRIELDTTLGRGTVFSIDLPTSVEPARVPIDAETATADARPRTILLVDDERAVREATRRVLMRQGYSVCVAESAEEALDICRDAASQIDLVLSDVVMPGMSGVELAEVVRRRYPRIATLLTSGYPDVQRFGPGASAPCDPILRKPFSTEELLARIRSLLPERAAAA